MVYSHKEPTGMFQNTMEATEQCRTLQNIMETHRIIQNLTELHRTGISKLVRTGSDQMEISGVIRPDIVRHCACPPDIVREGWILPVYMLFVYYHMIILDLTSDSHITQWQIFNAVILGFAACT